MPNSHKSVARADAHPPGTITDYMDAAEQGSNPGSPASGYARIFVKADGLYIKLSDGTVIGPLTDAGGGGGSGIDITDGITTVMGVTSLTLDGATITDDTGGAATMTVTGGGGGDFVKIAEATPSGTGTVTFNSIPGTYRHLKVVASGRTSGVNDYIYLRVNNDSGSNYDEVRLLNATGASAQGQTRARIGIFPGSDSESGNASGFELTIPNYADTNLKKTGTAIGGGEKTDSAGYQRIHTFWWRSTAAITRLDFAVDTMNFAAGTVFTLYGMN